MNEPSPPEKGFGATLFDTSKDFAHSALRLACVNDLPLLEGITEFSVQNLGSRSIEPTSLLNLFRSLPRLRKASLKLDDYNKYDPQLRKQLRLDFSSWLREQSYKHLEIFDLHFSHLDHVSLLGGDVTVQYLRKQAIADDPLPVALKQFVAASPRLKHFSISGPICTEESLFWPSISQSSPDGWANVESFVVHMSAARPDGRWYFYDKEPGTIFYLSKADAVVNPNVEPMVAYERVLQAAARAAALMPKLDRMCVAMGVYLPDGGITRGQHEFEFTYWADTYPERGYHSKVPMLLWEAPPEWKMGETLAELWHKVIGPEGVITYNYWPVAERESESDYDDFEDSEDSEDSDDSEDSEVSEETDDSDDHD